MSAPKFTPGPWKLIQDEAEDWGVDLIIRMGDAIRSPHAHDAAHAFTYYEGLEPEGDNKEWIGKVLGNAHLIAAAPSLYAVLEKAADSIERMVERRQAAEPTVMALWANVANEARSALAKARGEK